MRVLYSRRALRQLNGIESYIASAGSPRRAASYVLSIMERCERIGLAPYQGTEMNAASGVRRTGFENRVVILFRPDQGKVEILSIAYGGKQP